MAFYRISFFCTALFFLFSYKYHTLHCGVVDDTFETQRKYLRYLNSDCHVSYRKIADIIGERGVDHSTIWRFVNNKNSQGRPYRTSPRLLDKFRKSFMHVRRHENKFDDANARAYIKFLCRLSEDELSEILACDVESIKKFHAVISKEAHTNHDLDALKASIKEFRTVDPWGNQRKFITFAKILKDTLLELRKQETLKGDAAFSLVNLLATLTVNIWEGQPLSDGNHHFSYYLCQKILSRFNLALDMKYEHFDIKLKDERLWDDSPGSLVSILSAKIKRRIVHLPAIRANTKKKRSKDVIRLLDLINN